MLNKDLLDELKVVDFGYTEEFTPIHYDKFKKWINEEKHLPLKYLADHRGEMRNNLKAFYPEFQSALVFLFSYHHEKRLLDAFYSTQKSNGLKLASYTLGFNGNDYHSEIRESLLKIFDSIKKERPEIDGKISLDIHPVLERDLALRAGLGFQGKNSMLISKRHGSFFIIGSLLLNQKLDLTMKGMDVDHCGQCTKCIDHCPTKAIDPDTRTIISKDCISTFTIEEFKLETIPSDKMSLDSGYVFGCDICQNVCPWNLRIERQTVTTNQDLSNRGKELIDFFLTDPADEVEKKISLLSNTEFLKQFKNSSFERSGKRGILKNLIFYLKKRR